MPNRVNKTLKRRVNKKTKALLSLGHDAEYMDFNMTEGTLKGDAIVPEQDI